MELQFKKSICPCLGWAVREVSTQELTQELRLSDGMPDMGRVLGCWGCVNLRSKEWQTDTIGVSGGVQLWVLYAPEDGTEPRCLDTWIPFQLRWDMPDVEREGTIRVCPQLRFADGRLVSARKLMVRVGISALAEALYPMEPEVSACDEAPEDVQLLRNTYPVRLPREAGEKHFLLDDELPLPSAAVSAHKLLGYTVQPEITERKVLSNKVVFRGNANVHLLCSCGDAGIRSVDVDVPFSQLAELNDSYSPEAQVDILCCVTSLEVGLTEGQGIHLKCGLVSQYLVDDRLLLPLVEDAYSPRRMTEVHTAPLMLPTILEERREVINAEQSIPVHGAEVIDVSFWPDYPRIQRKDDGVLMELSGVFQVLCRGQEGMLQSVSGRWETDTQLPADANSAITVRVEPQGRPYGQGGGEEIQARGQLVLKTDTTAAQGMPMVTALELGELQEPNPERPSVILCRPGTQSLWEIAKQCGSTGEAISQANGGNEQMDGDRMLLIPVL